MANIKDLKKKIKSTKGTLKITTAMKLVSAAKLSKAQAAIHNSRPYAEELENTIKTVSALAKDYAHPFLQESSDNKMDALLLISSNKGLCGSYNSALIKEVRHFVKNRGREVKVYFIGRKGKELLGGKVNEGKFFEFEKQAPDFLEISKIGEEFGELFRKKEFGRIMVAYNIFRSAIRVVPTVKQVLPFALSSGEREKVTEEFPFDFKYEPSAETILDELIPKVYVTSIWTCLLDAMASEHGSRMSAMDNAVSNCKEAIYDLTLKMNKLRQSAITTELIEVVSGAESLNG